MTHPLLSRALLTAACAGTVVVVGCQEEPQPLFDEDAGAWVLQLFRLEAGDDIGDFGSTDRTEKYFISYDKAKQIVAAATCNDSSGNQSVTESLCDLSGPEGYTCRCFNYEFDQTSMTWTEFKVDGQPPPPEPDEEQQGMGALPVGTPYQIALDIYQGYSNTYRYRPLPFGLFDSNGHDSEYVFQLRDKSKFAATGCDAVCGFTSAETPMQ